MNINNTDEHRLIDLNFIQLPNKKWHLWYITLEPYSCQPKIHSIIVPSLDEINSRVKKIKMRYRHVDRWQESVV